MPSFFASFLWFLPLFFVVNVLAAVPGRDDLGEAVKVGLRHFIVGTLGIWGAALAIHYGVGFLIDMPPLFG